jgi:DnaJ-like protein
MGGMVHWYESSIDRQLREAAERGEFENLPGAGKPLPDHGREYDEDWWVKDWLQREGATAGVIPPTLALRRETEEVDGTVDRLRSEREVRDYVDELNERLRKARVGLMDGPPVVLPLLDAGVVVAGWRERRATSR